MKVPFRFVTILALVLVVGLPTAVSAGDPVPRRVLAVHQPLNEPLRIHPLHKMAEMPLNHLGYTVEYRQVETDLREEDITDPSIVAVVTWFQKGAMANPEEYLRWAMRMVRAGKKLIMLGYPGIRSADGELPARNAELADELFRLIGFRYEGDFTEITFDAEIVHRDSRYFDFERRAGGELPPYEFWETTAQDAEALLTIRVRGTGRESDLFIVSPRGAMVQGDWRGGWVYFEDPVYFRREWYINPFALFRRMLGDEMRPVPDVTTHSGRRMYYSHIDGDGWRNVTLVKPYKKDKAYSSRVVMEEAIKAYPDLPVTVGPIAADLDEDWSGDTQAQVVARELFELPQVEMAHHTFSHPFQWGFFEDYSQNKEASFVRLYNDPSVQAWGVEVVKGPIAQTVTLKEAYNQPRGFGSFPFEMEREFGGAADVVDQYAPPGKKVEMVLWSGDTAPTERMIRASRDAGLLNLNGGDSRLDPEFPSVSYVPPVGFKAGTQQQVYASNSNENTYTDLWSGRFFGFRDLVHTLRNTEYPRRLKPINIYYHMYSGERTNALNGLLANLDYVRSQKVTPVKASHYARIGEGFFSTNFRRTGAHSWTIHDRGALQTIRFDDPDGLVPDMAASTGVLGFNLHLGNLYVALDPATETPEIVLVNSSRSPQVAYLKETRWQLRSLQRTGAVLTFTAEGFGDGEMTWGGVSGGDWTARVLMSDGTSVEQTVAAGNGEIAFSLPVDAIRPLTVTLSPAGE